MAQHSRLLTLPGGLALAALLVWLLLFLAPWANRHHFTDYYAYEVYAIAITHGYTPYSVPQALLDRWVSERVVGPHRGVPDLTYPPLLPILCIPLTALSPGWSVPMFSLLSIAAVGLLGLALCQLLDRPRLQPLVFLGLAVYGPIYSTLHVGQINNIIAMTIAVTLWMTIRQMRPVAGLALATGALIKILPVSLFAWMILRRDWRGALYTVAAALGVVGLTSLFFGYEQWADYARSTWLVERAMQHVLPPTNQSLFGLCWAHVPEGASDTAAGITAVVVGLVSVGMILVGRKADPDGAVGAALLITATAFVFPLFRDHHQVVLTVPLIVLLREAYRLRLRIVGWALVVAVVACLSFTTVMVEGMIRSTMGGPQPPAELWSWPMQAVQHFPPLEIAGFLGMLLLWLALAFRLGVGQRAPA